ncbi:MAG: hypothetical protein C5B52_10555 [Bacteroidetes bacterium]|nr:MAG: hypothetical protein C5B52_10555 [Bacteroidota bacterium]
MGFEMKRLLIIALFFWCSGLKAQNLNGQWRGSFNSAGNIVAGEGNTEYVLELEFNGTTVSGYSYTYFDFPGRRCYVLCRLEGNYEPDSKSIVVTEVEKIKSNTPPNFIDCLQTHILTFFKQGSTEKLVGRWKPARKTDNCGTGSTELERRVLTKIAPAKTDSAIAKANTNPPPKNNTTTNTTTKKTTKSTPPKSTSPKTSVAATPKKSNPTASNTTTTKPKPKPKPVATTAKPKTEVATKPNTEKPATLDSLKVLTPELPAVNEKQVVKGYENRPKNLLKTIEVSGEEFKVDLYDNGEIDGDSISVFFNGKLMVSHQRLSDKPITLKIKIDPSRIDNDLVMYAENLGSIPPNTALMVVTIGEQRYEVRITSTEQTSGTVRFKLKE